MLYIFRGVICSGKSTTVGKLVDNGTIQPYEVVSSDEFRCVLGNNPINQNSSAMAFSLMRKIIDYRLSNRLDTFLDATNLRLKSVKKFCDIAKRYNIPVAVLSIMPPSIEEIKRRNQLRYQRTGLFIPEDVVDTMYKSFHTYHHTFTDKSDRDQNFLHVEVHDFEDANTFIKICKEEAHNEKCITVEYPENVWIIGDVHGCSVEFEELCSKIRCVYPDSEIFAVGDLIDRGPNFIGCLDVIAKYGIVSTIGNHESSFVSEMYNGKECRSRARVITHDEYDDMSEQDRITVLEYFNRMHTYLVIECDSVDDYGVLVTHSGIPSVYGEPQCKYEPNLRDYVSTNAVDSVGIMRSNSRYSEKQLIQVHGHKHWNYVELEKMVTVPDVINIDSGVVYGGNLTAVNPFTGELIQVKAKQTYFKTRGNE